MSQETVKVPVLVLGGGTGALGAALQCARSGTKCLLVTPGAWVGGMLSASGVSAPDGNELTPWQTGLWGALLRKLRLAIPEGLDNNWVSCFGFQPAQAEKIFRDWIRAEPNLMWMSGWNLEELTKKNNLITEAVFSDGINQLEAKFELLIDGTELGESMVYADVPYRLGWEAKEEWNEPSAPEKIKLDQDPFFQSQLVQSPTWVFLAHWQGGWNESSQVFSQNKQPAAPFQNCLKPHGLLRCLSYGRLPEDLLMLNWPINGNDWHKDPLAPFSGSTNRIANHLDGMRAHSQNFFKELQSITGGLLSTSKDNGFAVQPYWRESRRIIGNYTVTEQDLLPATPNSDINQSSIAIGNYPNDHHYPGPDWPLAPKSKAWGGRWSGTPFCIPFNALFGSDAANLLMADKGISVSHMANGATRLGPLVLNIGQAAGMAAALCSQAKILPDQLNIKILQKALIDEKTAPSAPFINENLAWHSPAWRQTQLCALDNRKAVLTATDAPPEPGEYSQEMELNINSEDQWFGCWGSKRWPLITLEPMVREQMTKLDRKKVTVVGRWNPWGPWWRINRLLP